MKEACARWVCEFGHGMSLLAVGEGDEVDANGAEAEDVEISNEDPHHVVEGESSTVRLMKPLLMLAGPNAVAFAAELVLPTVGTIFLGRTPLEQGAFAIGTMWCNAFGIAVIVGLAMGLDSLAPHAFGGQQRSLVGLYCQRAICIGLLSCVPVAVLWLFAEPLLVIIFRLDAETAALSALFVRARLPGLPPLCVFEMMRRFAQAQRLAWPAMAAACGAAALHVGISYVLIGRLGILGAGLAVSFSCWVLCLSLVGILVAMRKSSQLAGSWRWPSVSELFNWSGWAQFLRLALPSCLSLVLEWGGYEVYSALASQLGTTALASQAIVGVVVGLNYIVPLGVAQAGATLVGNALGAGRSADARRVAALCFATVGLYAVVQGGLALLLARAVAGLFSADAAVVDTTAGVFGVLWVYSVVDHAKCVGMALLRSTGRPRTTVFTVLLSQAAVGYPVAWLAKDRWGVAGIWAGIAACWAVASTVFALVLLCTDWDREVKSAQEQVAVGRDSSDVELLSN
jgi:MATE family multidrug resistance protein